MTKKDLKLTIEENILEKAKKTIPNLSEFFEECLKYYLGEANGMYPIIKDQEILDNIGKLQAKLYMNKQNFNIEENIKAAEEFEKDKAWRFLWNDYRVRLIPDETLMASAVKELGIDEETLEDILDEVYEARDSVDTDSWNTVYDWYKKEVE
jgi:hypothetical protein